jgi:hypothetical protein
MTYLRIFALVPVVESTESTGKRNLGKGIARFPEGLVVEEEWDGEMKPFVG